MSKLCSLGRIQRYLWPHIFVYFNIFSERYLPVTPEHPSPHFIVQHQPQFPPFPVLPPPSPAESKNWHMAKKTEKKKTFLMCFIFFQKDRSQHQVTKRTLRVVSCFKRLKCEKRQKCANFRLSTDKFKRKKPEVLTYLPLVAILPSVPNYELVMNNSTNSIVFASLTVSKRDSALIGQNSHRSIETKNYCGNLCAPFFAFLRS